MRYVATPLTLDIPRRHPAHTLFNFTRVREFAVNVGSDDGPHSGAAARHAPFDAEVVRAERGEFGAAQRGEFGAAERRGPADEQPRHPDRATIIEQAAALYSVSAIKLYRQLRSLHRPQPVRRADRVQPRKVSAA